MDVVALASVITAAVATLVTGTTAVYNTYRTAKAAREGRSEQRAADGYLKVLSLVEREAQCHEAFVFNAGLDHEEVEVGLVRPKNVAEPDIADRAAAAALVSALASRTVQESHAAWRKASDTLTMKLDVTSFCMIENWYGKNVPEDWMNGLTKDLRLEQEARKSLAEVVAHELGHRQRQERLRFLRR